MDRETSLEMALRHVSEGRARVETIQRILDRSVSTGDIRTAGEARRLLATFKTCLRLYEDDWECLLRLEDRRRTY